MNRSNPLLRSRWVRRVSAAVGILVILYAIVGFLVLPWVVTTQLPPRLSAFLRREVAVRRVRVNPFALSATVEGFKIQEAAGGEFLGWERLYVRVGVSSLFGRAVNLRAIELSGPYAHVVVGKDGKLNFADILARLQQASPQPAAAKPAKPPILRIGRLAVWNAQVVFLDRSLPEPFSTTLGPLSLGLEDFSTEPDRSGPYQFAGRTEAGESFRWSGDFSLDPLASQGHLELAGLRLAKYQPFLAHRVAFRLGGGALSARGDYQLRWAAGQHVLKLQGGSVALEGLELGPERGAPVLTLPEVEADGIQADLVQRSAAVASLALRDGRVQVVREADGALDLARLLTPKPGPPPAAPAAPFRLDLKELRLQGFRVAFRDLAPVRPVLVRAEDLDLTLRDVSLDPATPVQLTLAATLNGKARLQAEGTALPFRPAVDLKLRLDGLDLPPFDPYLAPFLNVRLNRGSLGLDGRVSASFAGKPTDRAVFQGDLRLERFEAADGTLREPFLGYRRLALTGLDVSTNPNRVAIRLVDLVEPSPRLVIAKDGSTNVGRALKLEPGPAPAAKPPLAAVGSAIPPTEGPPLVLSILRTRMTGGRLSFVDRSLQPNAALLITGLQGTATSLSSAPDTQSALDFLGLAGGFAPLHLQGRAMPLRKDQDTDVQLVIDGAALTDFSPYAGKYLGYTVRKGNLAVDARVRIVKRQLDALIKTRLDQFTLGDKTASPDAVHLPVKLCLAILRDRHGVIDLELPVDGSLDDPDLHVGKLVWKAILNILGKVAAAPFTFLAHLGGGPSEDLSFAAFPTGSAELDAEGETKAQHLAQALAERPELGVEIEGSADPVADAGALRQRALEALLAQQEVPAGAPAEPDPRLLAAYRQRFPQAAVTPPPPAEEMRQALLGSFPVGPDDLAQLAAGRAHAFLQQLKADQVDPARLFEVQGGDRARKEGGSRVYFGLR